MKRIKILALLALSIILLPNSSLASQKQELADYVNPLLGTSKSRWMLFPGASLPFGMVKLSPDNTKEGHYALGAGYEYKINSISGFNHVHSWMMAGFITMPTTGEIKVAAGTIEHPDTGYRSRIDNKNTQASAGYYSTILDDYNIKVELTATTRGGFQRYTFPKTENAQILFDFKISEEEPSVIVKAEITKVNDTEIEGYVVREAGEWNEYSLYFVARFDSPFTSMGGWQGTDVINESNKIKVTKDLDIGAFVSFDVSENQTVLMQTAISYVSIDQARLNLTTEMDGFDWSFDAAHKNAREVWNTLLGKIKVEGGKETDKMKFYTGIYRAYSSKTTFSDVNGKYVDACENVQQVDPAEFNVYGADAFWGSFWNLNQLWTLITPDLSDEWVNSLLELYDSGGWLHDAPGGLEYSSIMVAAHQIPFIVGTWQKGIRGYDGEKAFKAMKELQVNPGQPHDCGGYAGNRNIETYIKNGFVPADEGPVSNTLEYAYDDWSVAQMAKSLGKKHEYEYFMQRSQNYRNVFDPATKYIRPKHSGGPWLEDFSMVKGAGDSGFAFGFGSKDYVESNAWQFSWFVPHDMKGLISLMGKDEFNARLEHGFENSRPYFTSDYVNIGNQPNMQAPWLFNYSEKPWLTQYWVREVLDNYFGTGPIDGYRGDEDQGQMGSWFVMSAMGLFQMDGGSAVEPSYELSGPIFEKITIQLDPDYYSGKEFVIEAKNSSSENRYIQSATLNGQLLEQFWFKHSDLSKGGLLVLEMGPEPNKQWAVNSAHPQLMDVKPLVTTPYVIDTNKIFKKERQLKLACDTEESDIYYTLDGSEPTKSSQLYRKPFVINTTTTIRMIAYRDSQASLSSLAEIIKTGEIAKVYLNEVSQGLSYKYAHGIFRVVNDILTAPAIKTGIHTKFDIDLREKEQFFSFEFDGFINVPKDGEYTFYLATNDGGRLFLDHSLLLNNDGLHPVVEVGKAIVLTAGLHPISVKYFQEGGTNGLKASWEGPGIEKQEIPGSVLYHKK